MANNTPPVNTSFDEDGLKPSLAWVRFMSWLGTISGAVQNVANTDYQTPATGFSYTIPDNIEVATLDPAGTLATGTVTLPRGQFQGQRVYLTTTAQITALTVTVPTGYNVKNAFSGTLAAGAGIAYYFNLSKNTWYRFI